MPLDHTTILPEGQLEVAKGLFKSALAKEDNITVLVFGNTAKSKQAQGNADIRATAAPAGFVRQVVWMKDTSQWSTLKADVEDGSITVGSINALDDIAISISLSNRTEYVVKSSKTPDLLVMELAFLKGST